MRLYVTDPAEGKITYTKEEFLKHWASTEKEGEKQGIALLLEPTPDFYNQKDEKTDKTKVDFLFLWGRNRVNLPALVLFLNSLIVASTLGLIFFRSFGILLILFVRLFCK